MQVLPATVQPTLICNLAFSGPHLPHRLEGLKRPLAGLRVIDDGLRASLAQRDLRLFQGRLTCPPALGPFVVGGVLSAKHGCSHGEASHADLRRFSVPNSRPNNRHVKLC